MGSHSVPCRPDMNMHSSDHSTLDMELATVHGAQNMGAPPSPVLGSRVEVGKGASLQVTVPPVCAGKVPFWREVFLFSRPTSRNQSSRSTTSDL